MRRTKYFVLVAMVASTVATTLAAGCGDDDGGTPGQPDAEVPGDPDAGCTPGPDGAPIGTAIGDVQGTWAVLQLSTAVVTALNSTQISRNVYLYEMTQKGTDVAIVEHLCEIKVDDVDGLVHTRMLPALAPAIPTIQRGGTITSDGSGGFDFLTTKTYHTRGVTLVNIETDPMPTMADDPRVTDPDADGKPGVTLLLDGLLHGQAYVVQRDWNAYTAKQVDEDRIEGLAAWDSEQIYLGSDPPSIAELNATATPDPDPSKHTVLMVRVADGSTCATVLANQCSLFDGK